MMGLAFDVGLIKLKMLRMKMRILDTRLGLIHSPEIEKKKTNKTHEKSSVNKLNTSIMILWFI